MDISDLNGTYQIALASNIHDIAPGYHDFGEAMVEIMNGQINGKDVGGITFSGQIDLAPVASPDDVLVDIVIDPRTGVADAVVYHYDGTLKREPVNHKIGMKLIKANNSVKLKGTLNIGPVRIEVIVRKVEQEK